MRLARTLPPAVTALSCALALLFAFACGTEAEPVPGEDAGSTGSSGSSGTSGTSGSSGTSGTSGSSGTSGTSGSSGTSGTSGTSEKACTVGGPECSSAELCTDLARLAKVCRATCKNDADCTAVAGTSCILTNADPPANGACIPTCTPFGADCPAGTSCTTHAAEATGQNGIPQPSKSAFCRKVGSLALGAKCDADPTGCVANAECIFFPPEGFADSKCVAVCDAAHPCAAGSCVMRAGEAFGYCKP